MRRSKLAISASNPLSHKTTMSVNFVSTNVCTIHAQTVTSPIREASLKAGLKLDYMPTCKPAETLAQKRAPPSPASAAESRIPRNTNPRAHRSPAGALMMKKKG